MGSETKNCLVETTVNIVYSVAGYFILGHPEYQIIPSSTPSHLERTNLIGLGDVSLIQSSVPVDEYLLQYHNRVPTIYHML